MTKNLFIIGAGGVGGHIVVNKELYSLNYDNIYFLDDDLSKINTSIFQIKVLGTSNLIENIKEDADIIIGIANSKIRQSFLKKFDHHFNLKFPYLIAPNSWISNSAEIGRGTIIYPNTSINYSSKIGEFVVINMNCAIGHHVLIEDFSSLAPGVCIGGNTHLGKCVEMGIGSSTLQGISIGNNSIVGGKAMVINSFSEDSKIVGVPAKAI